MSWRFRGPYSYLELEKFYILWETALESLFCKEGVFPVLHASTMHKA